MIECQPISSPLDPNEKLSYNDTSPQVDQGPYCQLVRCRVWLTYSCLDLSFTVSLLGSFSSKPRLPHLQTGTRVLR
eukprot:c12231_g2_i1 orf=123-350(+)